jgi:arylsulfatase A-like enzyme
MTQPNILLIHADQHRPDCLGVNGHPFLETPNLDRLAAEGVNFTRAFCPIPLCTPARTSLLTGLWPAQHGNISNPQTEGGRPLQPGLPTWSQALREAGYFLGCVGKWGVDSERGPTDYGFHTYVPESNYGRWRTERGLPPRPSQNRWFGETDPHIKPEESRLAWGADRTIELMRSATEQSRPFCLRWDPSEPHLPNVVPEPFASRYPPEQIPPWPNFADDLSGKPFIQRQQRRTWGIDDWTWEAWAPIVGRYLGEVALLDQQIGRVLAALEESGLADQTIVIYSADHGDLCGSHGLIDKHFVMYDELVRVPLIVRWPGQLSAGERCENFVTPALDLAATFYQLAGAPLPEQATGADLRQLVQGDPTRSACFAAYYGNQFGLYSQRMVREASWKYIWNATAEDELYDLENDPGELHNLSADPRYADELARLRSRLVEWLAQTSDPLLNAWTRHQLLGEWQ